MLTKLARPSSPGSFRPYWVVPVVAAFFCFLPMAFYIVASA